MDKSPFDILSKFNLSEDSWQRNLFFVALSQFIAMVGMSSFVPFMPLFVVDLGVTDPQTAKFWSGMVFAGPYFLSIVFVPFWGYLGDKYGKKLMLIRAIFGLTIAVFLMGFSQNIYHFFLLRVLQGAISGMVAAALTFTASNTPFEKTGYAIGILSSFQSAGNIVGPLFGGMISDLLGFRFTFIFVASLIFISGILVWYFVKENNTSIINEKELGFIRNLKSASSSKIILFLMLLLVLAQAGIQFTNPIFPFFLEKLHTPQQILSTVTGIFVGIVGLMSIFFAPYWGRRNDNKDYRKTLGVSTAVIGVAGILHIFMPHYLLLFPLRLIIGIFYAAVIPTLYSAMNKYSTESNRGSVMGLASSANLFGSLIAFVSCGVVSSLFGLEITFVLSGLILLTVSALVKFVRID